MIDTSPGGPHSWVDECLDLWFDLAPVDATFVGRPDHDHTLPDLSPAGVEDAGERLRAQLASRPPRPTDAADPADRLAALDEQLMADAIEVRLWELESRWMVRNPSVHTGEAVFSLMSLLLPQHAGAEEERFRSLSRRLRGLPDFFRRAREQLDEAPVEWVERALRECRGGRTLVTEGLGHLRFEDPDGVAGAVEAFEEFAGFLRGGIDRTGDERVACGEEGLALLLARGHRLDRSADEVAAYARHELDRTRAWVEEHAPEVGLDDPSGLSDRLSAFRPGADGYYDAFGRVWDEMKAVALERGLLTWPDVPIRYAPRPMWSRAAAPDLYFLFYRSPGAYRRPPVHEYMVAPLPDDPDAYDAFLRANNDSVIKLNHVVHHGGIGHHVQNWHAFRSPLKVGRVAAVDAASRITMFSGGTMAEGWACYATDLMAEAGALTELEQFAEHMGRQRMCARAIVDVGIHHGTMTLEDAATFYQTHAHMPEGAARGEAVKNSMFPGAALMYLIGTDLIHELRADLMRIQGDQFDLSTFHDAFLSWGSIPVRVVADEMRRRARRRLPLGAHDPLPTAPDVR